MADNTGPEDQDLERLMRAGLDRHADEVDTAVPVAARARSAARRRRVARVAAGVGALAVAAATVTAVVVDRSGAPDDDRGTEVIDSPSTDPLPTGWRTEFWHDTQVEVPDDWGWGTAPSTMRQNGQEESTRFFCGGPGAMVLADGTRETNADPSVPYVGRPIMLSDLCIGNTDPGTPSAPYVWFDAGLEPGTVDLGEGWVQETIEVNGSTVTVATQDAALRERILGSATGGETCFSELEQAPSVESMLTEGMGTVRSGLLCVYRSDAADHYDLVYSRDLTGREGQEFEDSAHAAEESAGCARNSDGWEYAVVRLTGDDPMGTEPVSQDYVVDTGCAVVETSPGQSHVLTEANVRSWAGGGVAATMTGPSYTLVDWAAPYFIGMLG
jgi:hypothetical protein